MAKVKITVKHMMAGENITDISSNDLIIDVWATIRLHIEAGAEVLTFMDGDKTIIVADYRA